MSENEPGRPDDAQDDTRPLWQRDAASAPPQQAQAQPSAPYGTSPQNPQPPQGGPGPQHRPDYQHQPGYHGYGYPYQTTPMPQAYYQPPRHARPTLPGWVWPLVAVTALVVGLVGGTIGGALVSTSITGDAGSSLFEGRADTPAPLDPENGSVAAVADALLPSTVQILTRGGADGAASGSGFVADRRGHVITNNHVVSGVADDGSIRVVDHQGVAHQAEIVGRSPVYDIAVLEVDGAEALRPAAIGSSRSMNVGETVVAIGSPLGLSSTVTSGIVSALDRPVTTGDEDESSYINAVQTDAAINPGNSGGPLVNLRGEVVGVNSAIATMGGFANDAGSIGVGFAIPMEQVRITASQIVKTGEAKYPVIGANVNTGGARSGAEIVEVPSGTPAADAGLEKGDVVVAVDSKPVEDGISLIVAIRSHQPGETIALTVRRGGDERTVRVTLDAKVG